LSLWIWKRRITNLLAIAALAVLVYAGLALYNAVKGLPSFLGGAMTASTEWLGEVFDVGGERVFNPVELHQFYRTTLAGDSVLGHSHGVYHATGFQFIEGPGLADNENIILRDAGYLGQATVPVEGVQFELNGSELVVKLPHAEYFTTTLAIEPTIENNREGLAAIGQAFGDITDTRQARVDLKQQVDTAARQDLDLYLLAECMSASTLAEHILPGFFAARGEAMPAVSIVSASGAVLDEFRCMGLMAEVGRGVVDLERLDLPVRLDESGRKADIQLGEVTLPVGVRP
jgi:hypothetical protein